MIGLGSDKNSALLYHSLLLYELKFVRRSEWAVENPRFPSVGAEVNVYGSMVYGTFLNGYSSFSKILFSYIKPNLQLARTAQLKTLSVT